jgi:NAD(P)H-flavin reductase
MKDTQAIIERVRRINPNVQHLELAIDDSLTKIKPGQSLLVRVAPFNPNMSDESWHPYLREQWYPVNMVNNKLIVERPTGVRYEPGQIVNAMGLIGQPIRFRKTARTVLLIAYSSTPTPLLMTIPWLLGNKIAVTLVLLGSATDYGTQHLPPEVEVIRGSAGTEEQTLVWPNQVLTAGWADQVLVTVSKDDELLRFKRVLELFQNLRREVPKNYLFGVWQPTLSCGVGACWCCALKMHGIEDKLVCTDGPAFDLTTVDFK